MKEIVEMGLEDDWVEWSVREEGEWEGAEEGIRGVGKLVREGEGEIVDCTEMGGEVERVDLVGFEVEC